MSSKTGSLPLPKKLAALASKKLPSELSAGGGGGGSLIPIPVLLFAQEESEGNCLFYRWFLSAALHGAL